LGESKIKPYVTIGGVKSAEPPRAEPKISSTGKKGKKIRASALGKEDRERRTDERTQSAKGKRKGNYRSFTKPRKSREMEKGGRELQMGVGRRHKGRSAPT